MTNPVPTESPRDINYGKRFSEEQIRKAMHQWINEFKAHPEVFEPEGAYDADQQTDHLIKLMTGQERVIS